MAINNRGPMGQRAGQRDGAGADRRPERERAETIALKMIGYLASDDELIGGFMGTVGLSPDDLRAGVGDPSFLGGVMDYLLEREDLLLAFCDSENIDPASPMRLRHLLP